MVTKNTIEVGQGSLINIHNQVYVVITFDSPDSIIAKSISTKLNSTFSLSEITKCYGSYEKDERIDLTTIDDETWTKVLTIYNTLQPLLNNPARVADDIKRIADQLLLSSATIYRYLKKIESQGTVTCLLRKSRSDKNEKKLDSEIETIIKNVIVEEYLKDKRISPTALHSEIKRRCRNNKLSSPSLQTVFRRIEEIKPVERAQSREGRNAALDLKPKKGSVPNANELHSLWQIDHTPVDLILVDERDRIAIGRPWITLIIEIFSRMVVGWYVSFDTPGSLGTGLCISRAILPKDELLARYGVSFPWPCQGKPAIIMCDNAKEFRGNMLKNACAEHGVELRFRPVKQPNYGGHIERMLGTLLERIHTLDGTTFSNVQQRNGYDSEGKANMTLTEFDNWLANLILGRYHHERHNTLGCSPLEKYKEGIFGTETTPGIGVLPLAADPEKLIYDFLPFEERTIQPYGVIVDNIEYHDPVLDKWIGALQPGKANLKRKFIFRRDPRDISTLIFWDPHVKQYYRIPYRNARRPAISLWELRAIKKYMEDKGNNEVNEEQIFIALNDMRAIEDSAKEKTKKIRLAQERRRHHSTSALKPKPINDESEKSSEVTTGSSSEKIGGAIDFSKLIPFDEIEPM